MTTEPSHRCDLVSDDRPFRYPQASFGIRTPIESAANIRHYRAPERGYIPSLRPTEEVRRSKSGGYSEKQEDGACALNREVEYDEGDRE